MPSRIIIGPVYRPNSNIPWANSTVIFYLAAPFTYSGITYPKESRRYATDSNGNFTATLAVPASGTATYIVTLPDDTRYTNYLPVGNTLTLSEFVNSSLPQNPQNTTLELIAQVDLLDLADTPDSYAGSAGYALTVKSDLTGVEFVDIDTVTGTDKNYRHIQSVASATWTVPHNLSKRVCVSVVDSAGDEVHGNIHYDSDNQVTITFSASFSGEAYCN